MTSRDSQLLSTPFDAVDETPSGSPSGDLSDKALARLGPEIERNQRRGLHWLRFSSNLEQLFEHETGSSRVRQLLLGGVTAVLLYNLFLLADHWLVPDIFATAVIVRLAIVTPLALLTLYIVARHRAPVLRETAVTTLTIATAASVVYLLLHSQSPLSDYYHPGLIPVILFGNVVVQLRFWYALWASLTIIVLYALAEWPPNSLPADVLGINIALMSSCAVFTLFANYMLERNLRQGYLSNLRERVRRAELSLSNAELTRLSYSDPLTGLPNRREFNRYLSELVECPLHDRIAFVFLDIDHFKRYNDTYGHPAGDACLAHVAQILQARLYRHGDMVARIGGEEFAVVLPGANRQTAMLIANSLCQAVAEADIAHESSPVSTYVTISGGVAEGMIGEKMPKVLAAADAALYRAKQAGRNCVSD
ncbi:diguanylate cyclase [Halomonas shantousis]